MYAPLSLANNIAISDIKDSVPEKEYLRRMADGDTDLLISFYYDPVFLTHRYDGEYKDFNDMLVARWPKLYNWATGYKPDKDVLNKSNRATIKDSLMNMVVLDKWSRHKKAYLFDAEMELTLADVDHVDVPVRTLDALPFHTFYIQFAPDGIFSSNFHGCFVDIVPYENGYVLYFCRVTNDLATMSGSSVFVPDDDSDDAHFILDKNDVNGNHENDPNGLRRDWEEFCFFVLNAILALCSENIDINETRKTGNHYSPARLYDDKEVDMSECGFVFSQSMHLSAKQISGENVEDVSFGTGRSRKSPRPHPVKASWQHYWVGSGENKRRILKFKVEYSTGKKSDVASIQKVMDS